MTNMNPDLDWFTSTFRMGNSSELKHVAHHELQGAVRLLSVSGVVDVVVVRKDVPHPILAVAAAREADLGAVKTEFDSENGALVIGLDSKSTAVTGNAVVIRNGNVTVSASGGSTAAGGSIRGALQNFYGRVNQVALGDIINDFRGGKRSVIAKGGQIVAGGSIVSMGDLGAVVVGLIVPVLHRIESSGVGSVRFYDVDQDELVLRVSGVGSIRLDGQVNNLDAKVSGTGSVKAATLVAQKAKLNVSGTGDVRANVTEEVDAKVSGAGDIRVNGNPPRRRERVSGVGEIQIDI